MTFSDDRRHCPPYRSRSSIAQLIETRYISKADSISSIVHALGGIEDHIHLIVSIPPHLSVANFVKTIKGSSAHYLNQSFSLGDDIATAKAIKTVGAKHSGK